MQLERGGSSTPPRTDTDPLPPSARPLDTRRSVYAECGCYARNCRTWSPRSRYAIPGAVRRTYATDIARGRPVREHVPLMCAQIETMLVYRIIQIIDV